jgi:hypothetical protein
MADESHCGCPTLSRYLRKGGRQRPNALVWGRQHYDLEQELKPNEQMWIDVGKLIRDRVPDKSGALLPPGLTMGAYTFRDLTDPTVGNLFEGKVILDKTFGHAAYGCARCCGMQGHPYMYINPVDLAVSGQLTQQVMDTDTCTGDAVVQPAGGWRTDDSSVATAVNAVVTGMGAGQTTHYANTLEEVTVGTVCERAGPQTSGPVTVQVPTSLKVLSVTVLPNGSGPPNGCPGSANYGIMVDIKYQILDQYGKAIASSSMTPHEKGILFDGTPFDSNIGPFPGYPTSSKNTATDGTFHDVPLGYCLSIPITNATATQNVTMIMPDGSTPAVRSQTFTVTAAGTINFGHGKITNSITSPGTGSDISATR